MLGVNWLDWLVIVGYLVGITFIGIWAAKKVKSAASFFISDRKFGKVMMTFFMFGAGTHSDQAVSVAAKTYRAGASGIWYQWLWLFCTPFFWLIAPFFRKMRAVTTGDYFEARYGRSVGLLYALTAMLQLMVNIGVMLKGSSAMITAVSGGAINAELAILAMTVMFVIYGIAGGLSAAIVTDFVQGILTVVLSFLILPFALMEAGGIEGIRQTVSDPAMLQIVAPGEITLFFILVISLNALIGWPTQPQTIANCGAGRTEMEGRVGVVSGLIIKRICTIAWTLTGLCGIALYATIEDVDHVFGKMAHDILPTIAPGLVGLFIASMLAAVMSSCDVFMVACSGLFTENIYRKFIFTNKPDKHYVLVGRVASGLLVLCGIMFAFSFESVVQGLEIFWKVSAMMGIAFWLGLFWRRTTVAAAWTGTLAGFAMLIFTSKIAFGDYVLWDFNARFADKLPGFMLWEGKLSLPWQMIIYLSVGFIAALIVSLFTRRVDGAQLERFYVCLRTPIKPGEPEPDKPFTLPAGVEPGPRRSLIGHPDFEIPVPTLVGAVGFFATWVGVGLLIAAFFWILN
jgi:SSS family transporter